MDIFCESSQPDYVQLECGSELGGIIAIGLIDPDVTIQEDEENQVAVTLASAAWWTQGMNASPQTLWVVKDTRGSLAAGTPVEEEGFGLVPTERTGDDRELLFEALGVMRNRNFWAVANKRRNWKFVYVTAGRDDDGNFEAFYVQDVSIYTSEMIEQNIKSRKRYSGSAKWSTAMTPSFPFVAPASIFS